MYNGPFQIQKGYTTKVTLIHTHITIETPLLLSIVEQPFLKRLHGILEQKLFNKFPCYIKNKPSLKPLNTFYLTIILDNWFDSVQRHFTWTLEPRD